MGISGVSMAGTTDYVAARHALAVRHANLAADRAAHATADVIEADKRAIQEGRIIVARTQARTVAGRTDIYL